jgi:hypothetical protein
LFFVVELNIVGEGRVDGRFEDLLNSLDYIFTVLSSVNDPADVFLEGLEIALGLIEAPFTVNQEDFLDNSEDVQQ